METQAGAANGVGFADAFAGAGGSVPAATDSDAGMAAMTGLSSANPRKRKKASRACDFCHVNHQPCDNGQPRCSVCEKHDKPCLYLRPTKRRGPQKGYRTALNTYKESAAAWGAVLKSIPGLDTLIEGHLRNEKAGQLLKAVKDPSQQEALISTWQQSSVFKTFFGEGIPSGTDQKCSSALSVDPEDEEEDIEEPRPKSALSHGQRRAWPLAGQTEHGTDQTDLAPDTLDSKAMGGVPDDTASLSDLVAKDAARVAATSSQTLTHLGFAPDETILDFYDMGANPEPIQHPGSSDFDSSLGTEAEQRIYYELLMGRFS